jgi:hypothetical protein
MTFIPVVLESPFAGDIERNIRYARACMHDMLVNFNEAPYASHLLYTQEDVLDDDIPEERKHGIDAGLAFKSICPKSVFYTDFGISRGMQYALDYCKEHGKEWEMRTLPENLFKKVVGL